MKNENLNITELMDFEVEEEIKPIEEPQSELIPTGNDLEDDYTKSRETYHKLIDKGSDALEYMLEVAKQTDEPRAFEVVGQILKATSDVNKELLDMQKKMLEIKQIEVKSGPKNVTNNTLFIGSTKELQKVLKINNR